MRRAPLESTRPVVLRCGCGRGLAPIHAAGEFSVRAERACPCGVRVRVELQLTGWAKNLPEYRLAALTTPGT